MKAFEKYRAVFGSIDDLTDEVPWTTGVSNLVEHLLWDTKAVLGISKTELVRKIVHWLDDEECRQTDGQTRASFVAQRLKTLTEQSDATERYTKPRSSYCGPREALRRNRFFSEDYLNKEFDIFVGLASDHYLDALYGEILEFEPGGHWVTHGNSGLFENSTRISQMSMDNLAYNENERLLIANELKLGGHKNKDQMIKYAFLRFKLEEYGFIRQGTKFVLLFISDKKEKWDISAELEKEIEYCRTVKGSNLLRQEVLEIGRALRVKWLTWSEIARFNDKYAKTLNSLQQVEKKLLAGFSSSLREKAFLQVPQS